MKKSFIIILSVLLIGAILFTNCQQAAVTGAKVHKSRGDYDKAIEQCEIAVETNPEDAEAYFVMGQCYGIKKMFREMNEAFTNALKYSQQRAPEIEQERLRYWIDLFNAGNSLTKQNKLNEAIVSYNLAIEIIPDKIEAYQNLGFSYIQSDNIQEALKAYSKASEIDPENLHVKNSIGALYYQDKEYTKAIEILEEVLAKADPQSQIYNEAIYNLAYCYDLMGDADKAIETYDSALKANPNDKDLIFNMGRLYFQQEKYEKAIEIFQQVLSINPEDFETNYFIGNSYGLMEKYEESIPYLEKASQIKPDDAATWNRLGIAYVRTGQPEKGKAAFDKEKELQGTQ